MSDNEIYDSQNETADQLPSGLTVSTFVAARGKEIQLMKKSLLSNSGTKLAFQKLPKHMRRRAMSHNVKRLPRRLREIHLNQMKKSGLPPKQKRPSRKYRRRPHNLLSDYMMRQRKHKWLNTHLWHAKRFHMIEKWGYKLPYFPCDRAFRACYRATVNHCLLQDISYYCCVQIKGHLNIIVENFKKITDVTSGLTIAAKTFISGSREGSTMLFRNDDSEKAIGTIYFNWRPSQIKNKHILWIWIHAAFYSEAMDTIIKCFNLNLNSMETDSAMSYINGDIELKELRLELNRFRLTGHLSNIVLHNCFQSIDNIEVDWLKNYYGNNTNQIKLQWDYWHGIKDISTQAELSPHMILSLVILDPRYNIPKKRTKSTTYISNSSSYVSALPSDCVDGPLWDSSIRNIVKQSKVSNEVITAKRSKLLVPGSDLEEKGVPIPIILIQRPGRKTSQSLGYGSGWDVILPSEWAQPLWISLIMWGARAGGLRESKSVMFESCEQYILHPDTTAGVEEENFISYQCKDTFFKLPPKKRTNYNKFGITSPFKCNWNILINEWCIGETPNSKFLVLRNKILLKNIQEVITSKVTHEQLPTCDRNCLVPVRVLLSNKGLCKPFAIICLPQDGDLIKEPMEPNGFDENEKKRKELRKNHKLLLKRLRQRRVRAKKKGKVIPLDMDLLNNYTNKMRKLWLPETKNVRQSCSREVIGFVQDGDFSFLLGKSVGIGYIAMGAITKLQSMKAKCKVLVRNTNSKQYRIGSLEIII